MLIVARLQGVSADAVSLRHEFGSNPFTIPRILLAARRLGMVGRVVRQDASRWAQAPLPAIAIARDDGYTVVAKCSDGAVSVYGSFEWRLFDFGGRSARYHAAESLLDAAMASRDATIQQVLGAVVQAYFDAITAKAVLADRIESESIANDTMASSQRRQSGGAASQNDVLQTRAALERTTLERNVAEADQSKALAVLGYYLGIPAGQNIRLPSDLDASSTRERKDLAEWMKEAEQRHPAIVAARAAVQAAEDEVAAARSEGRPTIDFTANYYQNGSRIRDSRART